MKRSQFVSLFIGSCFAVVLCSIANCENETDVRLTAENIKPAPWPMRSHDSRRTGNSPLEGPIKGERVWKYVAHGGYAINIEPTVTAGGVYFGTWGVNRKLGFKKEDWDKMDGKLYGLRPFDGVPLWNPIHPGKTPFAYRYPGRPITQQDRPAGPGLHLNWYNGTVEGTGVLDPATGLMYFGRGDGVLYALDPVRGTIAWKFSTSDPARPDDPEGGGEIVGGPLVTDSGVILFGTFAAPPEHRPPRHVRVETNAVYAINRNGAPLWRYPPTGSLPNAVSAPLAISPDGQRAYAITALLDSRFPCELLALECASGRLLWRHLLPDTGGQDIAVGPDGVIYVAGMKKRRKLGLGWIPVTFAVRDGGDRAVPIWGPVEVDGPNPTSHMAGGIALREVDGRVENVFVSTTIIRELNTDGGRLHVLDPASGTTLATWNPALAQPPCKGGLTDVSLDRYGHVYVGVRGRRRGHGPEAPGRMYGLSLRNNKFEVLFSIQAEHQIDWASPAIGENRSIYFGSTDTFGPVQVLTNFINPAPPGEGVKDANPVFYGVMDSLYSAGHSKL